MPKHLNNFQSIANFIIISVFLGGGFSAGVAIGEGGRCMPGDSCMTSIPVGPDRVLYVERNIIRELDFNGETKGADFCNSPDGCGRCCDALAEVQPEASCSYSDKTLECRIGQRVAASAEAPKIPSVISLRQ